MVWHLIRSLSAIKKLVWPHIHILTYQGQDKMQANFADDICKCIFLSEKLFYCDCNFTEVYFQGSNWQ